MKSKILSTCTSDEAKHNAAMAATSSSSAAQQQQRRSSDLPEDESPSGSGGSSSGSVFRRQAEQTDTLRTTYHIAWAVFQHLTTRKRYRHESGGQRHRAGAQRQAAPRVRAQGRRSQR